MSIYLYPQYYFKTYRTSVSVPVMPVCSTLDNYFVPIFAGAIGKVHEYKGKKMLVYHIEKSMTPCYFISTTMNRFLNNFHSGEPVLRYEADEIIYYCMKHFVYIYKDDKIVILYALCTTRDHIFNINPRQELDFKNSYLLINNNLFAQSIFKKMATKLKLLLNHFKEKGVNIIYTEDVNNLCLNPSLSDQKFTTINERIEFINNVKKNLGFNYAKPEPSPSPKPEPEPDSTLIEEFSFL